jgi:hypothetical protein
MAAVKFPRRYHQREDLRRRQAKALQKGQAGNNVHKAQETRARNGTKAASKSRQHASDFDRDSDCGSDDGSDFVHEGDDDSGYSSGSGHDEVTETYEEMRARFLAEGPVMPELSDGSKAMLKAEELRWKA